MTRFTPIVAAMLATALLGSAWSRPARAAPTADDFPPILNFSLDQPLPRFAIPPLVNGTTQGDETSVTVTAAMAAPLANALITAPAPVPGWLPQREDRLNPLVNPDCPTAYANIGGQPASVRDAAGAAGRNGC